MGVARCQSEEDTRLEKEIKDMKRNKIQVLIDLGAVLPAPSLGAQASPGPQGPRALLTATLL